MTQQQLVDEETGELIFQEYNIKVRAGYPFNYDTDEISKATGLDCSHQPTLTQQQFKDEADINNLVHQYGLTGELPEGFAMPQSGDFTEATDYHTAMNKVREAEQTFNQVPAHIRARFNNDPGSLMSFLEDDRNRDEALKLGLINKPPEQDRTGATLPTGTPPEQGKT